MKAIKQILLSFILCSLLFGICEAQWLQVSNGMGNVNVFSLAYSGNNIFAGTMGNGVYLSTNNGISWTLSGLNGQNVRSLAVNGNHIFAGTQQLGVYLSANNGANWTQTQLDNEAVISLCVSGNNIFAGTSNGVFLSADNGLNWNQSSLDNRIVISLAVNGSNVFAATGATGVYLSTDNGKNWTQTSLNNQNVLSLSVNGNNVFAGTGVNGVYLTTNNGTGWTQTFLNNQNVYSLAVNGNNIFAGAHSPPASFYVSTDIGVSWTARNEGLNNALNMPALCVMNNYIFAGTDGYGVYRRLLSDVIGIKSISNEVPKQFSLSQNYPNPFNPTTKIKFALPNSSFAKLVVYDALGRELATLVNEQLNAGTYEAVWSADKFSSGVYYYKLTAEDYSETKKMLLIK